MSKKILITGEYSYIGESFCAYATSLLDEVDIVDVRTDEWRKHDFSSYDCVVHVAAIVHKPDKEYTEEEYYAVNTQLAYDVAEKAKNESVKQFVLFSSMSVYGVKRGIITKATELNPTNMYGKSKMLAEQKIEKLRDESFCVAVLRPPMIYGKKCKGNYVQLSRFGKKFSIFPDFDSHRSMLHIENLNRFLKKVIDEKLDGIFCPQDPEYICVTEMMKLIAQANSRKMKTTKLFNPFIRLAMKMKISVFCKVFGTLVYDKNLCPEFDRIDLKTAINLTEK